MTRRTPVLRFVTIALASVGAVGCTPPVTDGSTCESGKCDVPDSEVPDTVCDGIIVDNSGAGHHKVAGRNNDAFASLVMRTGDGCPTGFADIMAKLRKTDKGEGCTADPRSGIATRLVSETAQASGKPTNYRAVVSRACGDRDEDNLLFSLSGIKAGATSLPEFVEIISFDEAEGVFNYYDSKPGQIRFFGSSKDMLQGPDGETRRCAKCHVSGGLIMKELDVPWLHWEGHADTPGAQQLVDANKDLGSKEDGENMEGIVRGGNMMWNETRIEHLMNGDKISLQQLLRPLFCTVEFNIDAGSNFGSPVTGGVGGDDDHLTVLRQNFLLDPQLGTGQVDVEPADYDAVIKQNGQFVAGVAGAIDTVFDHAFIERSDIDRDFVFQLMEQGFLDDGFVKDVLNVDFTRPVFSTDRCDLLSLAPEIDAPVTPDKVRDAFLASLRAADVAPGTPAATLLKNLETPNDAEALRESANAFTSACQKLGSRRAVENALAVTSLQRDEARRRPVAMEFAATLPDDAQNVNPKTRLHPKTCELVNTYVAP